MRSNKKVQLKNSGLQKETNQTKQRNSNYEQNKFKIKTTWNQILNCKNHVQVDYLERGEQDEDFGIGFTGCG